MSRTAYIVSKTRRVPLRPGNTADKSNPFTPPASPDAGRSMRQRPPSLPRLEKQRRALLALRARLQGNVSRTADRALSEYGIETTCASPDTADRANEILEQDLALSLLGSASGTLEQIEVALQRIEDGSYGRCTECDVTIPVARLEAIPYATCCVQCAAQQEFVP